MKQSRKKRNQHLRELLYPKIRSLPAGTQFFSADYAEWLSKYPYKVTSETTANLLRELENEVKPLGDGVWERI